jgi:hypothetical protein
MIGRKDHLKLCFHLEYSTADKKKLVTFEDHDGQMDEKQTGTTPQIFEAGTINAEPVQRMSIDLV